MGWERRPASCCVTGSWINGCRIKPSTCRSCLVFLLVLAVTFSPSRSPDIFYLWIPTFPERYFCAPFPPGTSAFVERLGFFLSSVGFSPRRRLPDDPRPAQPSPPECSGRRSAVLPWQVFLEFRYYFPDLCTLSDCISEPWSGWLCSREAQFQPVGLLPCF